VTPPQPRRDRAADKRVAGDLQQVRPATPGGVSVRHWSPCAPRRRLSTPFALAEAREAISTNGKPGKNGCFFCTAVF